MRSYFRASVMRRSPDARGVPDHFTFSKNRHERFSESDVFQKPFDEIVNQCLSKGLLTGKHLTVPFQSLTK